MTVDTGLRKFRLAMVQLAVGADKMANLKRAEGLVREAASNGAQIVSLPVSVALVSIKLYSGILGYN